MYPERFQDLVQSHHDHVRVNFWVKGKREIIKLQKDELKVPFLTASNILGLVGMQQEAKWWFAVVLRALLKLYGSYLDLSPGMPGETWELLTDGSPTFEV